MKCFKCEKEIDGLKSILPLDRPYVNLFMHRDCYKSIDDELLYVIENEERIVEYIYALDLKPLRKRRKKRRKK